MASELKVLKFLINKSPKDEYQETVRRLTEYTKLNETWITLPFIDEEYGTFSLESAEIHDPDLDLELFFDWICYMLPTAGEMKHTPEDYKDVNYRERAHTAVCNIHKLHRQSS